MKPEHLRPATTSPGGLPGFGAAVAVSLGLHAAVFLAFADRAPEGLDADTDAISVEIVVESSEDAAAGAVQPGAAEEPAEPQDAPEEPAAPAFDAPAPPAAALALLASPPEVTEEPAPAEDPPVFDAPAPAAALSLLASPPAIAIEPELPETLARLPSPRPQPEAMQGPEPGRSRDERAARAEAPARQNRRRSTVEETQRPSRETTASPGGGASAKAQRSAGAAGEASYGRKLIAHLQRFKRYPAEAERRRISGATKLAVTIDRSGRLTGARIAASSGHAILDEEALAAARRAAPYPRPPEGVGGATVAIAVTLRFAPR